MPIWSGTARVTRAFRGNVKRDKVAVDSLGLSMMPSGRPGFSGGLNRLCPQDAIFNVTANPAVVTTRISVHGDGGKPDPFDGQRKRSSVL